MSDRSPATFWFADDGRIPNNRTLPVLLYRAVRAISDDPASAERLFADHGWGGSWRNGIYDFHHYHSTAHEVLAIVRGQARVMLGGPAGQLLSVGAGDVIVLPAGTGHFNAGASPDLLVVGAYPPGQRWDLCGGQPGERPAVLDNIRAVPLPTTDPVTGAAGALVTLWRVTDRGSLLS